MVLARHHACRIVTTSNTDNLPVSLYVDDALSLGPDDRLAGIYSSKDEIFTRACKLYCADLTKRKIEDIHAMVASDVPMVHLEQNPNYALFANGIFDRETHTLIPYGPEHIVTTKCATRYVENAPQPEIVQKDGTIWKPEMLFPSMTSNPEIARLLWEGTAAALLPYNHWNRVFWLYSTIGCNGKGTTCDLWKALIGPEATASLNVRDLGKDFLLEELPSSMAIIADENPVGMYYDESDRFKAIITGDPIVINAKYKKPFSFSFSGLMVQCINEMPRFRDRSNSLLRRSIMIPFDQTFIGRENTAIKEDYIHRPAVLEWFAWMAMQLDLQQFTVPQECKDLLNDFKAYNSNVQEFFNEVAPRFSWDLIPNTLAYLMYKNWMAINNPSGGILGRNQFYYEWTQCATDSGEWIYQQRQRYSRAGRMEGPEPLILKYNVEEWINKKVPASNAAGRCTLERDARSQWEGIIRKTPSNPNDPDVIAHMDELENANPTACSVDDVNALITSISVGTSNDPAKDQSDDSEDKNDEK
jgi:putative DNA primase/helicase